MIYLDSSIVLAHVLTEDRRPPLSLWDEPLMSSRLLQYEVWTRLNARDLRASHSKVASALIDRVTLVELSPTVLERALEPFPLPVRTLDALHLASIEFLRRLKQNVELATYDQRLAAAARAMEISVIAL